nr:alpha/beta fold hydrolase [uncultured Blautia sp.]
MKKNKHKLLTTSILFTLATGIIYVINRLVFATAVLKNLLKSSADNYYNWRFGKVYYKKKGHGSPVLLIHDLTVYSSAYEWNKVVNELAETHTVYAIDLLGCGRSEKPRITYTNYLYVQLIADFIKNIIGEKADVIASGYSGSFTVLASYTNPEFINKIILINPPSLASLNKVPSKRSKLYKFILEFPIFGTLIYNIKTCQSNIQLLFTEKYLYNPFSVTPEMVDTYYEAAHKSLSNSKFLLSSLVAGYTNNNITHALKEINQSVTILYCEGETDSEKIAESYTTCNPAIESCMLKHAKHLPQLETPEKFLEILNIYL